MEPTRNFFDFSLASVASSDRRNSNQYSYCLTYSNSRCLKAIDPKYFSETNDQSNLIPDNATIVWDGANDELRDNAFVAIDVYYQLNPLLVKSFFLRQHLNFPEH